MADATLGPSAYIVLGLLAQRGATTSYQLKRWADTSVGYFWTFPRSQLYAEPQRLVELGLLSEQQEESGRRRRTFAITPAGRAELDAWLAAPAGFPELRDPGLLKLHFLLNSPADGERPEVRRLAAEQLTLHRERLELYRTITLPHPVPEERPELRGTLHMGLLYEEACIAFWEKFAGSPAPAPEPRH